MAGNSPKQRIAKRFNMNPSDVRYRRGVGWLYQDRLLHTSFYELQHTPAWATRKVRSLWNSKTSQTRTPAMIQIGSIVSIKPGSRYGLVKESFVLGSRTLFNVHYIDSTTAKLMKCPDSRCDGQHPCPIHGQNCTEAQLVPFTQADIEYFVQEGMIDPELLRD